MTNADYHFQCNIRLLIHICQLAVITDSSNAAYERGHTTNLNYDYLKKKIKKKSDKYKKIIFFFISLIKNYTIKHSNGKWRIQKKSRINFTVILNLITGSDFAASPSVK